MARPFRIPLNFRFRGAEISIISVIGVISCFAVFSLVALLHVEGRNFAVLWFAAGGAYYVLYKHYRTTDLAKRLNPERKPHHYAAH
jgi:hypothetical protein